MNNLSRSCQHSVRVARALNVDPTTPYGQLSSGPSRACAHRLSHVIPSPFVRLTLVLASPSLLLVPLLARRLQVPVRLKPSRRHPCFLVRATIAPVSRVSCTSCSTPRPSPLARDYTFRWTFSCLWTYSLPICMFCFSFLVLDSSRSSRKSRLNTTFIRCL